MQLRSIVERKTLRHANEALIRTLNRATGAPIRQLLGFRPENLLVNVRWSARHRFWFAARKNSDHYWLAFGSQQLNPSRAIEITVKINTALLGRHARAGLLLEDGNGSHYLAHTGRIGTPWVPRAAIS